MKLTSFALKMSGLVLATLLCVLIFSFPAGSATPELQITSPRANATVPGEVVEIAGIGADPTGTLQVEVLTNDWYLQTGRAYVNEDGTWTFSPVHLAGQGSYNNHTIRVTQLKQGRRGKSASVNGIVRRQ